MSEHQITCDKTAPILVRLGAEPDRTYEITVRHDSLVNGVFVKAGDKVRIEPAPETPTTPTIWHDFFGGLLHQLNAAPPDKSPAFADTLGKGDSLRYRLTALLCPDITDERLAELEAFTARFFAEFRAKRQVAFIAGLNPQSKTALQDSILSDGRPAWVSPEDWAAMQSGSIYPAYSEIMYGFRPATPAEREAVIAKWKAAGLSPQAIATMLQNDPIVSVVEQSPPLGNVPKAPLMDLLEQMREAAASTTFKPPVQEGTMVVGRPIPGQWDEWLADVERRGGTVERTAGRIFVFPPARDDVKAEERQAAEVEKVAEEIPWRACRVTICRLQTALLGDGVLQKMLNETGVGLAVTTCPECGGQAPQASPSTMNRNGRALCLPCAERVLDLMRKPSPPVQDGPVDVLTGKLLGIDYLIDDLIDWGVVQPTIVPKD